MSFKRFYAVDGVLEAKFRKSVKNIRENIEFAVDVVEIVQVIIIDK